MTQTITLKATPELVALAAKANMIQDAVNPTPIANFLAEVYSAFAQGKLGQEFQGTRMALKNPISLCLLDKLADLSRVERGFNGDAFTALFVLESGHDVEWEIDFEE